jgi:hypothetical protein
MLDGTTMSNAERSWSRTLLVGAIVWLGIAGLLIVQLWPNVPLSTFQLAFLVGFGPPLYVLGEGFFTWLFSPEHGAAISQKRFSIKRIAVALPAAVAALGLSSWLFWLLTTS